ncbi:MAG: hypothetical protein MJ186_05900, partial [Clostridia bacterium]|nr:hypothetical protein [Clostridia bacterium]
DPLPAYGLDVRLALSDLYKSHSKHEGATSQEYKDLEHALEAVVLTLEDNPGMNLTKEMLDKAMPDILKKCEAYEKHCMENSVIFGKDKRETRLNVARTLKNIANNYLEGKDSPREDLENDLKERVINTLVTAALQPGNKNEQLRSYAESLQEDKSLRDEVKENLSDSQHFRDLMEKKSASELSKLLTSDTKSFLKEVVSVVDGNNIMQTEVQKHAEKTESLDEAKDLGFTF